MKRLSLLSLLIVAHTFPMLSPIVRSAVRPHLIARSSALNVHNRAQSIQRRAVVSKGSDDMPKTVNIKELKLSEFIEQLRGVITKDVDFWEQLRCKEPVDRWHVSDSEMHHERLRDAAWAEIFGKGKVDLVKHVKKNDHELVAHLVSSGVSLDSALSTAINEEGKNNNDCKMIAILLNAGAPAHWYFNATFEVLKLLLEYGADVKNLTEYRDKDGYIKYPFSPAWDLLLKLSVYPTGRYPRRELTNDQYIDLLKRIMLLMRAGDPFVNISSANSSYPDGDWTRGKFPDLPKYLEAAVLIRQANVPVTKKKSAERTMRKIMKKYGMQEKDLEITPKVPAASSRIQE